MARRKPTRKRQGTNPNLPLLVVGALAVALIAGGLWYNAALARPRQFVFTTERGTITVEVYPRLMPRTVANFQRLVTSGFYDGLTFHRVEDWVVQGGDPAGDGSGGPGWTIKLEVSPELPNVRGALAMARSQDPNSAGSQFYILREDAPWLDGMYAVFGRVIDGREVVDALEAGDTIVSVRRLKAE